MQVCSIVSFVEKTEKCLENLVKVGAHCMYLFSFFAHLVKLMLNSNWIIWKKQKQNRNQAAGHEKYCLRLPIKSIFIIFRDGFWIFIQVLKFFRFKCCSPSLFFLFYFLAMMYLHHQKKNKQEQQDFPS